MKTKKTEIKAIAFDIGGVLTKEDMQEHYSKLAKIMGYDLKKFYKVRAKYIDRAVVGKIPAISYLRIIAKEMSIKDFKKFKINWIKVRTDTIVLHKDVERIIKRLKENYVIASLTNILPLHNEIRKRSNTYKLFDVNILSCEIGLAKPDPRIYKLLIKKLKLKSEEIIFVDDVKEMLPPAKKLGIKTIHFRNATQLRKDLIKLGVKLK